MKSLKNHRNLVIDRVEQGIFEDTTEGLATTSTFVTHVYDRNKRKNRVFRAS